MCKDMCRHTGLIVCFACLLLSTSSLEKSINSNINCNTAELYQKYNINGSITLEGLDQILMSFKSICFPQSQIKGHSSDVLRTANHNLTIETTPDKSTNAWLYAGVSVLFISACGLAAVAVIKVLPVWLFQHTIQFLVALAVGTLTGDAVLHLIPHALVNHDEHMHSKEPFHIVNDTHHNHLDHSEHDHENHGHDQSIVWRGAVTLAVMLIFFVIERSLNIFGEWKQRLQSSKQVDKVSHLLSESSKIVADKLCRHHHENHRGQHNHEHTENHGEGNQRLLELREPTRNSEEPNGDVFVSCVKEVTHLNNEDEACGKAVSHENDCSRRDEQYKSCTDWQGLVVGKPLIYCASHDICDGSDARTSDASRLSEPAHSAHLISLKAKGPETHPLEEISTNRQKDSLNLYISEHHTSHHGHSHSHGHIHARPNGVASLAWLVLAGDGIHNLTDGLAIGAAFAGSLTGGFTTAFAVLCHELPHELGDFAVLLKAGMTVKQAMVCNLISSFLCLIGVLIGLAIGSAREASQWIFAATAGMFIYIALVDMMPELNGHVNKSRSAFLLLFIQMAGLICGFGIMLLIALYEQEFSRILMSQL